VPDVGVARACRVMNIDRSLVYRRRAAARHLVAQPVLPRGRPRPPLALSDIERRCVLDALNSERFANCSPRQTYATLLDEGVYLGSVRTMYRLLAGADQLRERRRQLTHPSYTRLTFRTSRTQFGANFVASPAGGRRLPGRRVA